MASTPPCSTSKLLSCYHSRFRKDPGLRVYLDHDHDLLGSVDKIMDLFSSQVCMFSAKALNLNTPLKNSGLRVEGSGPARVERLV